MHKNIKILIDENESSGLYNKDFFLKKHKKCFLSLSPYKSYTNYSKLSAIFDWLINYFDNILIVYGIYNDRWNKLSRLTSNVQEVILEIDHSFQKFSNKVRNISLKVNATSNITLFNWAETLNDNNYIKIFNDVNDYLNINSYFKNDLILSTKSFYSLGYDLSEKVKTEYSLNYLLEEISIFVFLYVSGYEIEIYPGKDLQILKKISQGLYEDFPYPLNKRTHISIKLEEEQN